ncbi:hypothetical protein DXG01_013674 [Tephrocybe rancida]|nr:hypothetical protein DXG01_013674 [Tephrocybe rancida]
MSNLPSQPSKHYHNKASQHDNFTAASPLIVGRKGSKHGRRARSVGKLILLSALCLLALYTIIGPGLISRGDVTTNLPKKLWTSWAQYSPYFAAGEYESAPRNCRVTQVNIIQRHGARYPTSGTAQGITAALDKLLSVETYSDSSLNFLKTYTYPLGQEDLILFGASQTQDSGREHYERYKHLLSHDQLPFVRATGMERVVLSATNWTAGFSLASHHVYKPRLSVILNEEANDTLNDHSCPNSGNASTQTGAWLLTFGPPIAARLNKYAPGANIDPTDVYNLMLICAFESIFNNHKSPFCDLFSQTEFEQLEYYGDLDKYYNTGYGQELGPVQGVGYVNELIARLSGTPVSDNTQTNRTLDASPETFPLNCTIYADFSHDNQMIAIYAAMGLFKQSSPPNPTSPNPRSNWITSHLTPFSARMITEKLTCTSGKKITQHVRIFVNDALQPLESCGAKKDGLCTLDAFVKSQSYARNNGNGDFEKCFA